MRNYAVVLVTGLLAFVLGIQYQRLSQPDFSAELQSLKNSVAKEENLRPAAAPSMVIASQGISREELREEMQRALQVARAAELEAASAEVASTEEDSEGTHEQLTQQVVILRDQATDLIDAAIVSGTWSVADREHFQKVANQITDTHSQLELFQRLGGAINDGTLKWDSYGPAF